MKCNIVCFALNLFICINISGQIKEWTGSASDDWFNPANWNPSGVPVETDAVQISTNGLVTIDPAQGSVAFAQTLLMQGDGKLSILSGASLYINTDDSHAASLEQEGGQISSAGNITLLRPISDGLRLKSNANFSILPGGSLTIEELAYNANGAGIEIDAGCLLTNEGVIDITGGGSNFEDGIVNHGIINNNGTGVINISTIKGNSNSFSLENYGEIDNKGSITLDLFDSEANIQISGAAAKLNNTGYIEAIHRLDPNNVGVNITNGALLYGDGTIQATEVVIGSNGSRINPGSLLGIGTMVVQGDFFMDEASILELNIHGDHGPGTSQGHDRLEVLGNIELENVGLDRPNIDIILANNYVPQEYDNFAFIKFSGTRTGVFDGQESSPPELSSWGSFNISKYIVYRNICSGNAIIKICIGGCSLFTGLYIVSDQITYTGYVISDSEVVRFSSPTTNLGNGFEVQIGGEFEINTNGCN